MPRPAYRPTAQDIGTVRAMASYGVPQDKIAQVLGIDAKTMRKHFKKHLEIAAIEANATVAQGLFRTATAWMQAPAAGKPAAPSRESVLAMIFWLKARAGWSDRMTVSSTSSTTAKVEQKTEANVVISTTTADTEVVECLAEIERMLAGGGGITAGLADAGKT